ncbi:MAG: FtsL-like putative cell division protein [Bacteroidota bacterium]
MAEIRNTINTAAPKTAAEPAPAQKPRGKKKSGGGNVKSILEGSFLLRDKVIGLLPFLIFLTGIGLLYIFNSNYANRTIISISKTKKQIEEQRFEYINTKSKLMQTTRQTGIAKRLQNSGLKESKVPPRKILVEETNQ